MTDRVTGVKDRTQVHAAVLDFAIYARSEAISCAAAANVIYINLWLWLKNIFRQIVPSPVPRTAPFISPALAYMREIVVNGTMETKRQSGGVAAN
nr:hypothetical protein CFP56_75705 [Quercus suber]